MTVSVSAKWTFGALLFQVVCWFWLDLGQDGVRQAFPACPVPHQLHEQLQPDEAGVPGGDDRLQGRGSNPGLRHHARFGLRISPKHFVRIFRLFGRRPLSDGSRSWAGTPENILEVIKCYCKNLSEFLTFCFIRNKTGASSGTKNII